MHRIRAALHRPFLTFVFAAALVVWAALVLDTADLARRATTPPVYPTPVVIRPTMAPTPASPRIVVPPTPVAQASAIEEIAAEPFHPKTGRYIAAWLPDSFG